ncbi:hypothetical protein [Maricaulis sp. CAU 1757]
MSFRLAMMLIAGAASAAGFSAVAWSLVNGQTDQAIAYAWPIIGLTILFALIVPTPRRQTAERGEK